MLLEDTPGIFLSVVSDGSLQSAKRGLVYGESLFNDGLAKNNLYERARRSAFVDRDYAYSISQFTGVITAAQDEQSIASATLGRAWAEFQSGQIEKALEDVLWIASLPNSSEDEFGIPWSLLGLDLIHERGVAREQLQARILAELQSPYWLNPTAYSFLLNLTQRAGLGESFEIEQYEKRYDLRTRLMSMPNMVYREVPGWDVDRGGWILSTRPDSSAIWAINITNAQDLLASRFEGDIESQADDTGSGPRTLWSPFYRLIPAQPYPMAVKSGKSDLTESDLPVSNKKPSDPPRGEGGPDMEVDPGEQLILDP